MSDNDFKIGVPVDEELMKNKRYNPRLYSAASILLNFDGMIEDIGKRTMIQQYVKSGRSKFMKEYDYLIEAGMIKCLPIGNQLIRHFTKYHRFVTFDKDELEKIVNILNDFEFKVYCLLLNKYDMYEYYKYSQYYNFSKSGLLKELGFSLANSNFEKVDKTLDKLSGLGLIVYDQNRVAALGSRGSYMPLVYAGREIIGTPHLTNEKNNDIICIEDEEYRF